MLKKQIAIFGLALALAFTLVANVHAQTTDTSVSGSASVTTPATTDTSGTGAADTSASPGLPNTGVGGDALINYAILLSSGLAIAGGLVYIRRQMVS